MSSYVMVVSHPRKESFPCLVPLLSQLIFIKTFRINLRLTLQTVYGITDVQVAFVIAKLLPYCVGCGTRNISFRIASRGGEKTLFTIYNICAPLPEKPIQPVWSIEKEECISSLLKVHLSKQCRRTVGVQSTCYTIRNHIGWYSSMASFGKVEQKQRNKET